MNITFKVSHQVIFQVRCYYPEEGGMNTSIGGPIRQELSEALHDLELIRVKDPEGDWIIACEVETKVS